jgi:hypothetical protein
MKLITLNLIIATATAIDTEFNCPSGDIGACCQAYDPGDKLGYRCSFLLSLLNLLKPDSFFPN